MAETKTSDQLDSVEQDDEFEEFAVENWGANQEDHQDSKLWGDNWDDDTIDDAFTEQLRAELSKNESPAQPPQQQ